MRILAATNRDSSRRWPKDSTGDLLIVTSRITRAAAEEGRIRPWRDVPRSNRSIQQEALALATIRCASSGVDWPGTCASWKNSSAHGILGDESIRESSPRDCDRGRRTGPIGASGAVGRARRRRPRRPRRGPIETADRECRADGSLKESPPGGRGEKE